MFYGKVHIYVYTRLYWLTISRLKKCTCMDACMPKSKKPFLKVKESFRVLPIYKKYKKNS